MDDRAREQPRKQPQSKWTFFFIALAIELVFRLIDLRIPFFFSFRKPPKTPGPKRKFAVVLADRLPVEMDENIVENAFVMDSLSAMPELMDIPFVASEPKNDEQHENSIDLIQPEPILTASETMTITSNAEASIAIDINESNEVSPIQLTPSLEPAPMQMDLYLPMDISPTELPATPLSGNSMIDQAAGMTSLTTPSVPKERKRRIIIDDDDESPTFNPLRSNKKIRGKNRRNRQNMLLKKQRKVHLLSPTDKTNENGVFTSPEAIVSSVLWILFFL